VTPIEAKATRLRRRRKKTTTWVAGIIGVVTALAPHIPDVIRVILKR
jgi:hypothetical protein